MARLDIESFEKGIEKIDEQIRKLEERKEKLQEKIDNTIECPKCHWHWDAMYLLEVTKNKEVINYRDGPECETRIFATWSCPMCRSIVKDQLSFNNMNACSLDKNEHTVILEGNPDKVTKVKEIRERFS